MDNFTGSETYDILFKSEDNRYELYKESVYKKYIGDTKYESKNTIT